MPPRVLIADDNPDLRRYLTSLLAPQFNVEAVGDANVLRRFGQMFEAILASGNT